MGGVLVGGVSKGDWWKGSRVVGECGDGTHSLRARTRSGGRAGVVVLGSAKDAQHGYGC